MTPTKGDAALMLVEEALRTLRELSQQAYEAEDIGKVLQPLASRIELFLRSTVFPLSRRGDTFKTLIDDLANLGLPATEVTKLDALRDHYNKIKHQAGFVPGLVQSMSILRDARDAIAVVVSLAPGRTNQPADRKVIHHLQVGFWDNYVGGDTEIAISLPSDHWTGASTLDFLYIRAMAWDDLKVDLLADPRFHFGQEHFSPEVWNFMSGEGDFLNAGIWEGSYRDLIRILAKHEWREINDQLLPGLARQHNATSVGTALTMAAVDIAGAGAPQDAEALTEEILRRADTEYALDTSSSGIRLAARQIADLILTVPSPQQAGLIGPVLRAATQAHPGPLPLLLADGQLIYEFGSRGDRSAKA